MITKSMNVLEKKTTVTGAVVGLVIQGQDVTALYPGRVVYIGYEGSEFTINVRTNSNEIIRYCGLTSIEVSTGSNISKSDTLGHCKSSYVIEYAASWKAESDSPVRIGDVTYYKHDPTEVVSGEYELKEATDTEYLATSGIPNVSYSTEYLQEEFKRK